MGNGKGSVRKMVGGEKGRPSLLEKHLNENCLGVSHDSALSYRDMNLILRHINWEVDFLLIIDGLHRSFF